MNEDIFSRRNHAIFNSFENENKKTNYILSDFALEIKPKTKNLTTKISSKYDLTLLGNSILKIENLSKKNIQPDNSDEVKNDSEDLVATRGEQDFHYLIINKINYRKNKKYKISPLVNKVYELCNGQNTVTEIIEHVEKENNCYELYTGQIRKNVITALNQLFSIEAITVPLIDNN